MRRGGFSLMEMTVVLLILAISAAAVTLRIQGPLHNAQMGDVVERVAEFDLLTRTFARENDQPVWVCVDLNKNQLRRSRREEDQYKECGRAMTLPEGFSLSRLMLSQKEYDHGEITIRYSRRGLGPSYVLRLTGPGEREQWVLMTGVGGQLVQIENEEEARNILEATKRRPDAG
ncbi:MAG: prepilin-type N-terminal cleavage/methylation domain-containing protein [Phycisphaerae bacterium]|nr:prepilin-type N-terminal cleavage/methylation domain-containing protein [Phycisphaerae bacterium]